MDNFLFGQNRIANAPATKLGRLFRAIDLAFVADVEGLTGSQIWGGLRPANCPEWDSANFNFDSAYAKVTDWARSVATISTDTDPGDDMPDDNNDFQRRAWLERQFSILVDDEQIEQCNWTSEGRFRELGGRDAPIGLHWVYEDSHNSKFSELLGLDDRIREIMPSVSSEYFSLDSEPTINHVTALERACRKVDSGESDGLSNGMQ